MRKLILYISISLDGYIAGSNDNLDWLEKFPNPNQIDYGYPSFYDSIDTLIMGGKTFRVIRDKCKTWPYPEKIVYIISHIPRETTKRGIHFLGDNWIEEIEVIKAQKGKDIWLVGGGEITSEILKHELLDRMILTTIPILLGEGVPLFKPSYKPSKWTIVHSEQYENGVFQTDYRRIKE